MNRPAWPTVAMLSAFAAARAADIATSAPVLAAVPHAEKNPLVRWYYELAGVPGYVIASVVGFVAIVAITEWVARADWEHRWGVDVPPWMLRGCGYALPTGFSLWAAGQNASQLAEVLA